MTEHNEHYWLKGRNGWTPTTSWQNEVVEDKDNKWGKGNINPKMFLSKEELEIPKKKIIYKFNWHLDKVVERIVNLLKEKNTAYGNTALNPPNVFSKLDSTEAICARLDDKLSRIKNKGINDKTEDTVDDIIGYLLLLKMSMER
tara:strand:+ start:589 stop:1020 length:432 start_codon:yes stop_codon:yes gene_type:complete